MRRMPRQGDDGDHRRDDGQHRRNITGDSAHHRRDDDPHYFGHRERLRARFSEAGGDALPDYELLELILFRSIPRRDVKPIAKDLIKRFGTFAEVLAAPPALLLETAGVGEGAVTDLKIVEAAARRLAKGAVAARPVLSSWTAVLDYCRTAMAFMDK